MTLAAKIGVLATFIPPVAGLLVLGLSMTSRWARLGRLVPMITGFLVLSYTVVVQIPYYFGGYNKRENVSVDNLGGLPSMPVFNVMALFYSYRFTGMIFVFIVLLLTIFSRISSNRILNLLSKVSLLLWCVWVLIEIGSYQDCLAYRLD